MQLGVRFPKQIDGIWLPEDEEALLKYAGIEWKYQWHKVNAALKHVKKFELAIDIGAHVGLISRLLVQKFEYVIAYEALEEHVECFKRNVPEAKIRHCALGAKKDLVGIHRVDGKSACSWIEPGGILVQNTLDDSVLSPDFIKVDCEGYEAFVLLGAKETLERARPVVMVEQKPGNAERYGLGETDAVSYLCSLGATLREEIDGDYILSW